MHFAKIPQQWIPNKSFTVRPLSVKDQPISQWLHDNYDPLFGSSIAILSPDEGWDNLRSTAEAVNGHRRRR